MPPLFPITLALYSAACALYLAQLAGGQATRLAGMARLLLVAAFFSHAVDIGFLCLRHTHPFTNTREALSFLSWLSVGGYLATTVRVRLPLAGALIVPLTLLLDVAARLPASVTVAEPHTSRLLLMLHVGLATAGIAAFAVAAGAAAVYLYADAQLKARRPSPLHLPPLATIDRVNHACIQLGLPLFTGAVATGAVWLARLPDVGEARLFQPQYVMAALAWVIYAVLLVARFVVGWRGRRAAWMTLGGFAATVGVLAIYYVRDLLARGGLG